MTTEMKFGARSDVGCVRENNEDSYRIVPEKNLFVLSDGMGGLEAGEVASRMAVDAVVEQYRESDSNPDLPLNGDRVESVSASSNRLASAIRFANDEVYRAAQNGAGHRGMGATIVAVHCTDHRMSVAHVGDSRIYRLRRGVLELLTTDHSLTNQRIRSGEAKRSERRVVTRALGGHPTVEVDTAVVTSQPGDVLLLCTDGLHGAVAHEELSDLLELHADPEAAVELLVARANAHGGIDNVTAAVVRWER
jgi:serine/threonine protein phosphatase PrpC